MARNFYSEISVSQERVEMLDGLAYRWFDQVTLSSSGVKEYLIKTPADPTDLFFYGRSFASRSTAFNLEIFAGPTFSDTGTDFSSRVFNRNSDYPVDTLVEIYQDPVITTDGLLVDVDETAGSQNGSNNSTGSAASIEFPRIMPKDTWILVRITNLSGTQEGTFNYKLFWSEVEK